MPQLKVDSITNRTNTGSVELIEGATIPSGKSISGPVNMTINGTLTGTFSGDGNAIINTLTLSKSFAIKLILDSGNQVPYRS